VDPARLETISNLLTNAISTTSGVELRSGSAARILPADTAALCRGPGQLAQGDSLGVAEVAPVEEEIGVQEVGTQRSVALQRLARRFRSTRNSVGGHVLGRFRSAVVRLVFAGRELARELGKDVEVLVAAARPRSTGRWPKPSPNR
jgi:hypothetical protein